MIRLLREPLLPLFNGRPGEIKNDIRLRLSHVAVLGFEIGMELWVCFEPPERILRQDEIPGAFLATILQFVNHVLAIRRVVPI